MNILKKLALVLMLLTAFTVSGFGCGGGGEEDTGQNVGETMEETGEEAGQAMDEAGEQAEDTMDEAGEAAEDSTH